MSSEGARECSRGKVVPFSVYRCVSGILRSHQLSESFLKVNACTQHLRSFVSLRTAALIKRRPPYEAADDDSGAKVHWSQQDKDAVAAGQPAIIYWTYAMMGQWPKWAPNDGKSMGWTACGLKLPYQGNSECQASTRPRVPKLLCRTTLHTRDQT